MKLFSNRERTVNPGKQSQPEEFEIFPWNRNFETGLEDIDEQHQVLVDILNRLAWHCASDESRVTADHVLDELLSYAAYHFRYEEKVWQETLGESKMVINHHDAHQMFFAQIQALKQSHDSEEERLSQLLDYLTRWLAFHILESDRRMALTVEAVKSGLSVEVARDRVDTALSGSVSVLVNALLELYAKLSSLSIQLMHEKMARQKTESELDRLQQDRK